VGKLNAPISKVNRWHPKFAVIGFLILYVGILFLSTNILEMNECDAPVSNSTSAEKLLS
jgi:hypothetical protein